MMFNKLLTRPSILADLLISVTICVIICSLLGVVFYYFGNVQKLDTRITSLFGAILAFSGLMTKQYLLKENLSYLQKWKKIEEIIDEITLTYSNISSEATSIGSKLLELNNRIDPYIKYVTTEIRIIPVIPLVLVVLYGAALIASESQLFSICCLSMMLLLVSYLAQATISSNNLAIDTSELDDTKKELEDILEMLKE